MNMLKKIILFFLAFLIVGLTVFLYLPREEKADNSTETLRIGAGDDITGLLLEKIIDVGEEVKIEATNNDLKESLFNDYTFKDC